MHYIGMPFSLPVPVLYHYPTVVLSLTGGDRGLGGGPVYRQPRTHAPRFVAGGRRGHGRRHGGHALHRHGRHASALYRAKREGRDRVIDAATRLPSEM